MALGRKEANIHQALLCAQHFVRLLFQVSLAGICLILQLSKCKRTLLGPKLSKEIRC